jgi:hypothetical protein
VEFVVGTPLLTPCSAAFGVVGVTSPPVLGTVTALAPVAAGGFAVMFGDVLMLGVLVVVLGFVPMLLLVGDPPTFGPVAVVPEPVMPPAVPVPVVPPATPCAKLVVPMNIVPSANSAVARLPNLMARPPL